MSALDGTLHVVYGSPGTGKTTDLREHTIPAHIGRRKFVVYATSQLDDAKAFRWGPVVRNVRELDNQPCPEAVCVLCEKGAEGRRAAIELALRVRKQLGYITLVAIDEAHELWPEPSPRDLTEEWHTVRHLDGVTFVAITQWPAKMSKVLYRTAFALGSIKFFHIGTPIDLKWLRDEFSAAAAVEIHDLPLYRSLVIRANHVPPSFKGYVEKLRREAARKAT